MAEEVKNEVVETGSPKKALASFILSIVGLIAGAGWIVGAVAGLGLSIAALILNRQAGNVLQKPQRGFKKASLPISIVGIVVSVGMLAMWVALFVVAYLASKAA